MMTRTRTFLASAVLGLAVSLLTGGIPVMAEPLPEVQLKTATDLRAEGELARQRQVPILIMFSMTHCPYCVVVREEFLKPMLRSGDYADKVIIREIHTDDYGTLRDFDGTPVTPDELAHRYRASLSPTVVFVDAEGRELARRLVGITTVDYYGGFLDEAIDTSLQRLRQVVLNQSE